MERIPHKPKVFLSYSYKDERTVRALQEALVSTTDAVILDPIKEIGKGEKIVEKIEKSLKQSDFVLIFLSPESTESPNVLMELGMAMSLGKKVIPIVLRDTDISAVPFNLRNRQVIVNTGPKSTAQRLKRDVLEKE